MPHMTLLYPFAPAEAMPDLLDSARRYLVPRAKELPAGTVRALVNARAVVRVMARKRENSSGRCCGGKPRIIGSLR